MTALPPLPPPGIEAQSDGCTYASEVGWTAEQVEAIRRETVEACAQLAESDAFYGSALQHDIAHAIRALLEKQE